MRRPRAASLSAAVPVTTPDAAGGQPSGTAAGSRSRRRAASAATWTRVLVWGLLALIVVAGFLIRIWHNSYGLPYVYYYDEANHFTSYAVGMLSGNLDPGYYQNPSGFTYVLLFALHLVYGVFGVHLHYGSVSRQFLIDPTPIYVLARTVAAVLAMGGVVATFLVARRFFGARVALVAAAVLTFAFLPVNFSRIGVTDVGTFIPVAIALYGALRVHEDGRLRHYAIAGAGVGLACGFKYTAGLAILPLVLAAAMRLRAEGRGVPLTKLRPVRGILLAAACLLVVFAITTPFFFVHLHVALYQLKTQAAAAGGSEKLGQAQQGGFSYYLSSFTWGFGWAAALLALFGAVVEARRNRARAALLLIFPLALFLYMGVQTRYFGRWLLSIYPILSILAGIGLVQLVNFVRSPRLAGWRRPVLQGALLVVLAAAVLIQPVAADIRTANVLGRTDTRQLARDYLVSHYPPGLRAVIEPAVPENYDLLRSSRPDLRRQFVRGFIRDVKARALLDAPLGADTSYANTLKPSNIDAYRSAGYCVVVTMSLIRGRVENTGTPAQRAYYKRLLRESTLLYSISPYRHGRKPVPLHFDFSYDYYPTAYYRPGAIIDVYRLNNCVQGYGSVGDHPYGNSGLDKGTATSYIPASR